jgi:glycosyltransferase involved in cell wall biosynthesis
MNDSTEKHLHIVSFNVPYPPDYGGVIDVYYKIKALYDLGVKIHLHCFHYGRDESEELAKICHSVQYYERKKFYQALYSFVPYIIGSRRSGELLENLTADDYPILFEGLHTCFYLSHPSIRTRIKAVRMHNVEWEYYKSLKEAERNYLIKYYFNIEAKRLKKFEEELKHADRIFAISKSDYEYLRQSYESIEFVSAFHSNETVTSKTGKGDFILYHGNLGVVENNQAALFIVKKIAAELKLPFIIAGKQPTDALKKEAKKHSHIELIENPTFERISDLLANAQINFLTTFQNTGIKLKLLNSLYRGRFCLVNSKMVNNTGLESLCIVEDNPNASKRLIEDIMAMEFDRHDINKRKKLLDSHFSNRSNAEKIIKSIWDC